MLLMSFSQKGIDELRRHQEHMLMRHPDGDYIVSEGFDDGKYSYSQLVVRGRVCYRSYQQERS